MNRSIRWVAMLIGLALLVTVPPAAGAERPNLLFILSDDHAAHAVSAYGSRINRTLNLSGSGRLNHLFGDLPCNRSTLSSFDTFCPWFFAWFVAIRWRPRSRPGPTSS